MLSIGGIKKLSSPYDGMFQKSIGKHPKGTDPLPKPNLLLGSQLAVPEIPRGVNVEALRDYTPEEIKQTLAKQRRLIEEYQRAERETERKIANAPKNAIEEFFKEALAEARLKKVKEINNSYLLPRQKEERLGEELNKISNIEGGLVAEADALAEERFLAQQSAREVMSGAGVPSFIQTADPMGESEMASAMERQTMATSQGYSSRETRDLEKAIDNLGSDIVMIMTGAEPKGLPNEEIRRILKAVGYTPSARFSILARIRDAEEVGDVLSIQNILKNAKRYLQREARKSKI